MKLVYKPKVGFMGPGSGWPAGDHEEKNEKVAEAKLNSGFYHEKGKRASVPAKGSTTPTKRGSQRKGN